MASRPLLSAFLTLALVTTAAGCDSGSGGGGVGLPGAGYLSGGDGAGAQAGSDSGGQQSGADRGAAGDTGGTGLPPWMPGTDYGVSKDSVPTQPTGGGDRIDPACTDGQYSEALPTPEVSIAGLISGYTADGYMELIESVLQTRYPVGLHILQGGLNSGGFGGQNCVDMFLRSKSSASEVLRSLSTLVHECGHMLDINSGGFSGFAYVLTPDLSFTCQGGRSTTQGGRTFARSLIKGDDLGALRAPCGGSAGFGCDSYADIYLDGDPNDGNFDGGDQGFGSVLEETVQYVNSLATAYAIHDQYVYSISERDGILTFLWYMGRYLRMARNQYPDAYEAISGNDCWRDAILSVWGRAWLFLQATEGLSQLGIDDAALLKLATSAEVLGEIELLRTKSGCP
jgi:hypothetical protein